ncbi:MAG: alpha-glucosidase [Parvularculaceae bacterium]|nr:alpha-glucosidase [Parvularculaceae bacterium]
MISDSKSRTRHAGSAAAKSEWWRGATIYQIYPRSFKDSNGDGVGDLKGVIDGLDYVANLGVDGLWLSPFFTSPMRDFGYDVADFCGVDPIFGSLTDFDALIAKAHGLGLKVIIDQVYSHTSDIHDWFAESRSDRTNAKADWYVWADPKDDGSPPNNWQSVFGGPAWTWDSQRRQYYFHNFLSSQPDLNLHNMEVQDAILKVTRFWLDRGVDGFRLDALNFLMHDPALRDNPPASREGRKLTRPFDYQIHKYSMSHSGIVTFLERLRSVLNEFQDIFTVAEIGGPDPLCEMKAFTANDKRLNSAYSFDFLYADKLTPARTKESLTGWNGTHGEGWPSWAFSNHDAPRAVSRWAREQDRDRAARLYAMLLISLRGNIFIYQGEELGLPQAEVPFDALQDPEAIANWPLTLGRDGARTPLPWRRGALNSGFSSGRPWLPIDPRHDDLAVDVQEANQSSVLHFVRKLIGLRRESGALRYGSIAFEKAPGGVIAFSRRFENERVACAFNIRESETVWEPDNGGRLSVLAALGAGHDGAPPLDKLPALSGYIAREII